MSIMQPIATPGYTLGRLKRRRADSSQYWSWCIKWFEGSTRRRISLGTTDRITAEAQARKLWANRTMTVADDVGGIVLAYLDSLNGNKDEKRKREAWKAAAPYWAKLRVGVIDDRVSQDYSAWRQRAINTVRNELSLIRSALHWAAHKEIIVKAPKIIVPAIPDSSVDHLTKAQFRQFLEGCSAPHVRLFAILGVTTGARKTALLDAKWDQVDWARATLDLKPKGYTAVGNKSRAVVALNDRAIAALREAFDGSVSDYIIEHNGNQISDIKKGIAAAAKRSGIKAHPHMFRHSAAVWMAEDRVPMTEIAAFLGHRDINITIKVYARYHPDYLRQAARSLDW
jgi:integrase